MQKLQVVTRMTLLCVALISQVAHSSDSTWYLPADLDYTWANPYNQSAPWAGGVGSVGIFCNNGGGPSGVVEQSDGKVVVVGQTTGPNLSGFAVGRITTEGYSDDYDFRDSDNYPGYVVPFKGSGSSATAVALQSDQKIVAVGISSGTPVVVRLNTNGTRDTSFNGTGDKTISFGGTKKTADAIAIQSDGKILVAGSDATLDLNSGRFIGGFTLVRLNTNGSYDTSFGGSGKIRLSSSGNEASAKAVLIQSSGKIIVAGTTFDSRGNSSTGDFAVSRCNANGSLDSSFGYLSSRSIDFASSNDIACGAVLQSGDSIVVAGTSNGKFALARVTSAGAIDSSFGVQGKVTTAITTNTSNNQSATAYGIAVQSDNKLVVVGDGPARQNVGSFPDTRALILARYNTSGSLDTSFVRTYANYGGINWYEELGRGYYGEGRGRAVTVVPSGRIYAAGTQDGYSFRVIAVRGSQAVPATTNSSSPSSSPSSQAVPATTNSSPSGDFS